MKDMLEDMLEDFCVANELVVTNTTFQQHPIRLYTWTSPLSLSLALSLSLSLSHSLSLSLTLSPPLSLSLCFVFNYEGGNHDYVPFCSTSFTLSRTNALQPMPSTSSFWTWHIIQSSYLKSAFPFLVNPYSKCIQYHASPSYSHTTAFYVVVDHKVAVLS